MAFVSLRFAKRPPPSAEEVKAAMRDYVAEAQKLGCSSAPEEAIVVFEEPDRPQPRLDRETSAGYAVSVGRVREGRKDGHFDIRFAALSHNTVIGAAGSSIFEGGSRYNQRLYLDSAPSLDSLLHTKISQCVEGSRLLGYCLTVARKKSPLTYPKVEP